MKIEKISDYQIRCTLNKQDLIERQMKISELAYGTEKAKELFNDMIRQASFECGFVPDDLPLLVEAIPVSSECLVLVITKVDDPDELDARFSDFTAGDEPEREQLPFHENAFADEILNMFKQAQQSASDRPTGVKPGEKQAPEHAEVNPVGPDFAKVFIFKSLDEVSKVSKILAKFYNGRNSLYKDSEEGEYLLVVTLSKETPENFNKVCNILTEYASVASVNYASGFHIDEMCEAIVKNNAVKIMAGL